MRIVRTLAVVAVASFAFGAALAQATGGLNIRVIDNADKSPIIGASVTLSNAQGFLKTTPGSAVQYEFVANYIAKVLMERDVRAIGFDRWSMKYFRPWLVKAGVPESMIEAKFKDFGQGWISMDPALRTLEENLQGRRLRHGMQPVLRMCAANAVVHVDARLNRTLDKKRSRGRIDGMVALAMATSLAVAKSHEKHVYNQVPIERILETV
jgi:phage terminase large subunit-like protein